MPNPRPTRYAPGAILIGALLSALLLVACRPMQAPPSDAAHIGESVSGHVTLGVPGERCSNDLAWVEDLASPHLDTAAPPVVAPGQPFRTAWRVRNTGTCAWDTGYRLVFTQGEPAGAIMGGRPRPLRAVVEPGGVYTLEVAMTAPISPGVYLGNWQMENAEGRAFGEQLRAGVQVAGVPTPTPAPTQMPAPGVTFAADAERVLQGNPVSFTWDVQGAQEVYFYRAGEEWQGRSVAPQGRAADIPQDTSTYHLRVLRDGREEIRTQTVYVDPNYTLPQVHYFALAPTPELAMGQCVGIAWQLGGDVQQAALFRNQEPLWEDAPLAGTYEDCPEAPGDYEYGLGAQGAGGRNYAVSTIRVVEAAGVAATPSAGGPAINLFAVQPQAITIGECIELRWVVAGEASSILIERDGAPLLAGAPRAGSGHDCPLAPGPLRYTITAESEQGAADMAAVEVRVGMPSPTATPAAPLPPAPTAAPPAMPPPAPTLAPPAAAAAEAPQTPVGMEYVLISYRDAAGALVAPLTGTRVTSLFGAEGALRGDGGCNQYSSTYTLNGPQVTLSPIGVTDMFCAEPIGIMDQEGQYLSALQTAAAYTLDGGLLTLLDGAGNPAAVFVSVK